MLTLADILKPRHVDLALDEVDSAGAIDKLARRLEGDPGMSNWAAFQAELKHSGKPIGDHAILVHVRTDHVSAMLMAAGRRRSAFGGESELAADLETWRFVFLVAVPNTLASEYLRLVGALARILRNPVIVSAITDTVSPEEFVQILCAEAASM